MYGMNAVNTRLGMGAIPQAVQLSEEEIKRNELINEIYSYREVFHQSAGIAALVKADVLSEYEARVILDVDRYLKTIAEFKNL